MKNIRIGHLFFGSFLIGGGLLLTSAISSCSDAKSIKISKNSDLRKYLIDELTPIYTNKNQTENSAYKCGHKLLDLNKLSNDHNNYSNFNIVTDVDFGFLIDPNESAHIYSSNHSKIIISSNNKHATGFVIGSAIIVDQDYGYNGKLVIDSNISLFAKSFSPEMDASWACGLYAGDLNVSLIDIGATFNIYANDYTAYGVRIGGIANPNSVQKFSGVFIIKAIYHEAAGIVLASSVDSRLETNGIFDIEAIANDQIGNVNAYGVWVEAVTMSSVIDINGAFSVSAPQSSGTYGAYGCYFFSDQSTEEEAPELYINATFSLFSKNSTFGIDFFTRPHNLIQGIPIFYSSCIDKGNWCKSDYANCTEYWNGVNISPSSSASFGEGTTMDKYYDTRNVDDYNMQFYIASQLNDDSMILSGNCKKWIKKCFNVYLKQKYHTYLGSKWVNNIKKQL